MNIIIVGAGKVGYALAEHLSKEGCDITIIDNDMDALTDASDNLDVICIKGSGLGMLTLKEAGASEADLVIATTSSDEVNMLCCLTAKRMGVPHIVARIRDPEYSSEIKMLQSELGLDMIINPEQETAREISRILAFPTAISVDSFARGRVELLSFRIREEDGLDGKSLQQIAGSIRQSILFCAILRGEEVCIPTGQFILQAGDIVYILGTPSEILGFFKRIGRDTHKIHSAMILGGGRIAYYLCKYIAKAGIQVKLIEIDRERCQMIDELFPNCMIIHGDGTDDKLLLSENIQDTGAIVCLTGRDEYNIITGLYASKFPKPKIIVKITRQNYEALSQDLAIDSFVNPKTITASQIIRYVRAIKNSMGSNIVTLYKLVGGKVEALQFVANSTTRHLNENFRDVNFKKDVLVAAIIRDNKTIIPKGNDCIRNHDNLIIITRENNVTNLNDIFQDGGVLF